MTYAHRTLHLILDIKKRLSVNCSGLNKKLTSGEDNRCPLHFYIQSDENSFLKVVKVPKTKSISFDKFDEIIGCFQFGVGIR